jgi:hypothetical protein
MFVSLYFSQNLIQTNLAMRRYGVFLSHAALWRTLYIALSLHFSGGDIIGLNKIIWQR